jgi:L-arabinose isomerase
MNKEELRNFNPSSVDHYQVAYKYDKARDPQEYRTQKYDTMSMALAAANFLDAGDYTIISVTPIYKTND